ncbi:hypothetical protein [Acrocarpospora pleiomorpha]|uniref:hypothetical protein n=1 Tax=Acrocarpospora pleiomorpha TaxID=90975 RepID=UPI00147857A9|nr:hypothetical protein [Acrocarpospora pleiomorpha]
MRTKDENPLKRWVALVATGLLVLCIPAPALGGSGAPNPAQAVKNQLRHQRGVEVFEVGRYSLSKGGWRRIRVHSLVQLSPTGPVGSYAQFSGVPDPEPWTLEADAQASRDSVDEYNFISTGGSTYVRGEPEFQDGKPWVRQIPSAQDSPHVTVQPINVYDPRVLTVLLAGKTGRLDSGGRLYQGTTTYVELSKAARSWYDNDHKKISWWLWTDAKGLPTRLRTSEPSGWGTHPGAASVDTRFSGWGQPLVVTAPPADQVIDQRELVPDYS